MQMVSIGTIWRKFAASSKTQSPTVYIPGAWRADVQLTYSYTDGAKLIRVMNCMRAPGVGVQAVTVLRFGQWLKSQPLPIRMPLELVYFVPRPGVSDHLHEGKYPGTRSRPHSALGMTAVRDRGWKYGP